VVSFEQFKEELSDLLGHLRDPDYRPSEMLCVVLGSELRDGAAGAQSEVLRVIEKLAAPVEAPSGRLARELEILRSRYVLGLTQEEAADYCHMSVRSMRRAQREAVHMLARLLWEHNLAREAAPAQQAAAALSQAPVAGGGASVDWRQQVRQELLSLQTSAPASLAGVGEAIAYAVELERGLAAGHGLSLEVGSQVPGLAVAAHPSVLRQILIMAIAQIARCTAEGRLTIDTSLDEGEARRARITLRGPAGAQAVLPEGELIREILAALGGTAEAWLGQGQVNLRVSLPAAGKVVVLVVDDNLDLVNYYRRCTEGTRYHIVHAPQGERTVDALAAARSDVIVLDIILPDADGWQLLSQLRAHPATNSVPIILCSIVREDELSRTLGAALYLPKPVQYLEFMRALDQAAGLAGRG
jgi:CheY-like chemotaxis protein